MRMTKLSNRYLERGEKKKWNCNYDYKRNENLVNDNIIDNYFLAF